MQSILSFLMDTSMINVERRTSSHGTPAEWVLRGLSELRLDPGDGLGPSCAKTRWHSLSPGTGDGEWARFVEEATDKGWFVILAFMKGLGKLWVVYPPEEVGKLGIGQRRHNPPHNHHRPHNHRPHNHNRQKNGGGGKGGRRR
jgi:hypothetical protein